VSRHRIPRNYDVVREVVVTSQDCCREILENDTDCLLFYPPALLSADSLTILKFYSLSSEVLSFLTSKFLSHSDPVPEFPFIPDDREDSLICMNQKEGESSILLVGRSGTGKTSIAVGRMWFKYKSWYIDRQAGLPNSYHQIFVTANRVLRDQVRKSFYSMKHGFNSSSKPPTEYPSSFKEIADGQFPLFLTQTEWLLMLDGTLSEPFFPRNLDGSLVHRIAGGFHEEVGMLDTLDDEFDEDDDWFQVDF
jgi:predicted NACHT family NTPase